MAERQVVENDGYLEKLKKLIPTEVTAAFLAINSLVPLESAKNYFVYSIAAILSIICWLYLKRLQNVTAPSQLIFTSFFAFPVWAINIMVSRVDWLVENSWLPGCILIIATVVAPLITAKKIEQ